MMLFMNSTTANSPAPPADADVLEPDDPRRHFAAAVTTVADALTAVRPDQYDLPTPCEGMTVAALQEHLVMVLRRVACAGRGEPLQSWPADAADVAPGEWLDAWRTAAHGAEVLGVYTNELAVHAWDLAVAVGLEPAWDTPSLEFALEAIHAELPTADRSPMWAETRAQLPPDFPWEDPFGPAVPVSDDAPLIDRLVAWNGREPSWPN